MTFDLTATKAMLDRLAAEPPVLNEDGVDVTPQLIFMSIAELTALVAELERLRDIVDKLVLLFNDFDKNAECDTCGRCHDCPTCDALGAYTDYKRDTR